MASLLSQVTNNPLVSGIKASALVQMQTCVDSAILVAGTVYQTLGLHKLTVLDVKHEFATLTATIVRDYLITVDALPYDACSVDHILDIGPKAAAHCGALCRTTASIKSISSSVSHEDGVALLSSYKEVQAKTVVLVTAVNLRIGSLEQGASGICDYGFNKLLDLYEALYQALLQILPVVTAPQALIEK
ncbi:hypothetical protein Clacol_005853 [Clathrus columnatus]|uniref:Uncharacterized protein n=1 Tax=Clathrus columnatus TaxID=1419009 RepID=A0AAV5AD42_9AGAM|nr:hypothetical protein Clacol_005853 [Clathrus columnatus]